MEPGPITIVDVIDHRDRYSTMRVLVVSRMPKPLFERRGRLLLIGHDAGFFQFYGYERPTPTSKAFAGRPFEIPMVDETIIQANGQWWDPGTPADFHGLLYDLGVSTIDRLDNCYVFFGGFHVDRQLVDEWLRNHEVSNNYHRYEKGHADYGKHTIKSRWETNGKVK